MCSHGCCLGMFNVNEKQHMAQNERKRAFIFNEPYLLVMQANKELKSRYLILFSFQKACLQLIFILSVKLQADKDELILYQHFHERKDKI